MNWAPLLMTVVLLIAGCAAPPYPQPRTPGDPIPPAHETTVILTMHATDDAPEGAVLNWSRVPMTEHLQPLDTMIRQATENPNESVRLTMPDEDWKPIYEALFAAWKEQHDDWMPPDIYIENDERLLLFLIRAYASPGANGRLAARKTTRPGTAAVIGPV